MVTTTTRWKPSLISLFIYTITICSYTSFARAYRDAAVGPTTKDHAFITVSIDKLLISSPPENCCTKQKLPNCEICTYTCKFHVSSSNYPKKVFIDHQFDCSTETIGKKIQIPLLSEFSEPKIDVEMAIFTKSNDQLVHGLATLYVDTLEHEPRSRLLRINIEDYYDIDFNVSMTCVEGFVGPYCNISCVPPKKGEHHICSYAGKFCEPGWMGENCTVPICTYGCTKGKCVVPNKCVCDAGWDGERCDKCKPTDECRNPYYDNHTKKCQCPKIYAGGRAESTLSDDINQLDQKYGKQLQENNSTYLTLSVLIIVLLVICALLLIVIVILTLRNSNIKWPYVKFCSQKRKTQPTPTPSTATVPSIIDV